MKNSRNLKNRYLVVFFLATFWVCFCLWLLHAALREISPDHESIAFYNIEQNEIPEESKKKALKNPNRKARTRIAGNLYDKNIKELPEEVSEALQVVTHSLREFSSATLESMDSLETFEHEDGYSLIVLLVEMLQTTPDPNIRIKILEQLDDTYEEFPLARLGEALQDPDPLVTEPALDLIKKLKVEELVTAVAMAVKDDDPEVRLAALKTFETLQELEAIDDLAKYPSSEFLAEMVRIDPKPELRMTALELLADMNQGLAVEVLLHATEDLDLGVSELAYDLLAEREQELQG